MTALDRTTITVEIPITLRLAVKADLPKLEWYGQYTHFRHVFRRTFTDQQLGRRLMLLAVGNNFPIGQIFILLKSIKHTAPDGSTPAYFYAFRVMEFFRGMGIGTRLIQEAESIVHSQGASWARIAVAKDNPKARQLYERLGYRIYAEDPGNWSYLDHQGMVQHQHEPCWLLEKNL
jgi:ribosomal protein S18 acetylase RimI-like enzyme